MNQSAFLKSTISGKAFSGTRSEQMSFSTRLKLFDKGELKGGALTRQRERKYGDVEDRLMGYVELRQRKYRTDKCGINWLTLRHKAVVYANELGYAPSAFKASDGWIANALRRHGKVGINLHGEANDMTAEEREGIMADWRVEFHELLDKFSIPPSRVYNGDQTGLYYQKLPNRIYVDKDTKHSHAGVK